MELLKPKKLQKGDTIGILAVSGQIKDISKINNAKKFFNSLGYNVVISDTCKESHRYMAGKTDDDCVDALHSFFSNDEIDAILCARGGYGTLRHINKINWDIIKNNPKIFAGYSDITILLAMMYKKCGLVTFHSPMANGDFSSFINDYTKTSFFNVLGKGEKHFKSQNGCLYSAGKSKGILWGGNLASLVSLCGVDFVPDEDIILFLEDLNEPVYKIDKALTQLFNIQKIRKNVKGIIFGDFLNVEDKDSLKNLFFEVANELKIPVSDGFKITHDKTKDTIPYGVSCVFDSEQGIFSILEDYIIY